MSWSPSVSHQLPAKRSLGQGFRGHKVRKGCFVEKTLWGWNRIGRGGRGLGEGLACLDYRLWRVNHPTAKLPCLRQEPGFCPPMEKSLERGTGRRRGSVSSSDWPMKSSGIVSTGVRTAAGEGTHLCERGPGQGPAAPSTASFATLGPLIIFFPCA